MSEEEIIDKLWDLLHLNTYLDLNNEMKEKCEIPREVLKRWFENSKSLLDLYNKEKEKNKELIEYLITQNYEINRLNLDKIRLEMSQLPDTAEGYKYLKHEYEIRLGRMNLEDYKRNYISKDKIREKIKWLDKRVIENSETNYFAYLTVGEALSFKHFLEKELLEEE